MSRLSDLLESGQPTIGIIGLGYVGLPLALVFAEADMTVIGFDVDRVKIGLFRRICGSINAQ